MVNHSRDKIKTTMKVNINKVEENTIPSIWKVGRPLELKGENMSNVIKNKNEINCPPYKCKVCGMGDIKNSYDICPYCGWENDGLQNE